MHVMKVLGLSLALLHAVAAQEVIAVRSHEYGCYTPSRHSTVHWIQHRDQYRCGDRRMSTAWVRELCSRLQMDASDEQLLSSCGLTNEYLREHLGCQCESELRRVRADAVNFYRGTGDKLCLQLSGAFIELEVTFSHLPDLRFEVNNHRGELVATRHGNSTSWRGVTLPWGVQSQLWQLAQPELKANWATQPGAGFLRFWRMVSGR